MSKNSNALFAVGTNVAGSAGFALLFAYVTLLNSLSGEEIYGWRMLMTFPFVTLLVLAKGHAHQVKAIIRRLRSEHYFWLTRLLSAGLLGVQLWLFVWAPANGYGLEVSLGYFTMPIVMVVMGRLAFKDHLSPFQKTACLLAIIGVINQFVVTQALAWPIWIVGFGYPLYFWLRRHTGTDHLGGLWFDMLTSLPASLLFVLQGGEVIGALGTQPVQFWYVIGLGLISAAALACQSLSAPHLNLSLFGLLVYVEPVLLLLVALNLGETIQSDEWPTYIAIWLAVLTLALDGLASLKRAGNVTKKRTSRKRNCTVLAARR